MRVIVSGGTGFIGRGLCGLLARRGHEVFALTRSPARAVRVLGPGITPVAWDAPGGFAEIVEPGCGIVNLAGENIAARWSAEKMRRIMDSRVQAGQAVVRAVKDSGARPGVLVQASAVGYYGPRGAEAVRETEPAGQGFLAEVAARWEESSLALEDLGVRRAVARTGMVLGPGGALARMLPIFRLGLGGPLGNGRQGVSWIHIADEIGALAFLLENPEARGPFNLTAPEAVSAAQFARALGRALGRPALIPVPGFALRALYGQMADEVLLSGQMAHPSRLLAAGYGFAFPGLSAALADLLGKKRPRQAN
ncbi:MAG: TIGR01777 family oxidoreductase [Desulfovibrionaceae bacterium]|nr:TIGR01777 family oxidoreductase [Desulfovibrionaceae bacterium]